MSAEKQYINLFSSQRTTIDSHSAKVMNELRNQAFTDFCRNGLPTQKVERYKYTNIPEIFAPDYGLNLQRLQIPIDTKEVFRCDIPTISHRPAFVINDIFYQDCVSEQSLCDETNGVIVGSLKDFSVEMPDLIGKYYGKIAKTGDDGVTAINTMFAQDGLFVYVPRGIKIENTIQVINVLRSDVDLMVNRRVLIVAEDDAEVKLLFCDHSVDDVKFLTTQVIEVYVGERANVELYCMEETHYDSNRVSNLYVEQQRDSRLSHYSLTLHNGVTRNRADICLKGEGAECVMNGCVIADRSQHVDNNTLIDHQAKHCQSNELYKYVLDEHAVGAFAGRVLVRKGADKTVSQETNQNLLAVDTARMFSQPELEIYADDVKCAHGSTVGQLNEAALFYMQQRGISLAEAKLLLQTAFVGQVIDQIKLEPLRNRLRYLVEKRFRGELNKCFGCKMCS